MKCCTIFFCLMAIISSCSLQAANPRQTPSPLDQAINTIWLLPSTLFESIQTSFCRMASAFERFWFHYTGRQLAAESEVTLSDDTLEGSLVIISQSLQEIHTISTQILDSQTPAAIGDRLSSLELETLGILQHATQKALQADLVAGGGGMAVLYWLYHEYNVIIPKRFPGTGILAVGTLNTIVPLLKPLGILLAGAYAWYKLKESILSPYKKKYQTELAQFRAELVTHKKTVEKALQKQIEHTQEFTETMENALSHIKRDFHEELKGMHQENVTLQKQVKEEVKKIHSASQLLQENIQHEQNSLRAQVTEISQELRTQTSVIQQEVSDVKKTNQQLSTGMAKVLPMLNATQLLIAKMKEDNARTLEHILREGPAESKTPAAKKPEKKEKRFGLF